MKYITLLLLAGFVCLTINAQESAKGITRKGIALNDEGKYDEAIVLYDEAIKADPKYAPAYYEKGLSCIKQGQYNTAIDVFEKMIDDFEKDSVMEHVYCNLGTAYDLAGNTKKSLKIFKKGAELFPQSYMIWFNQGVTFAGKQKYEDAIASFKNAIQRNPRHPGSHYSLAMLTADGNRYASLLSLYHFFMLEYESTRAERSWLVFKKLMNYGVKKTGEKSTTITLSLDDLTTKKKKEDDFSGVALIYPLMVASANDTSVTKFFEEGAFNELSYKMKMLITFLNPKEGGNKGFFWEFYVPFFKEMTEKKFMNVLAARIGASLDDDAASKKWLEQHTATAEAFDKWVATYSWPKLKDYE
jgi:Tfp pilus assembly protein PilF